MKKRINVLHLVNGDRLGGAERVQELILTNLDKKIFSPHCLCLKNGRFSRKAGQLKQIKTQQAHGSLNKTGKVIDYVKEEGIDIIHSHTVRTNIIGAISSFFTDVKFVTHVHSWPLKEFQGKLKPRLSGSLNTLCHKRADRIIAVSSELRRKLTSKNGLDKNIEVIKNGIDLEPLESSSKNDNNYLLQQLRLEEANNPKFVATAALFRPIKGTITLLESFSRLIKKSNITSEELLLLLIGGFVNNSFKKKVFGKIDRLGINDYVIHTGFREDVIPLMAGVDIFVLPSHTEGLPYSLLEAGGLGLPVIATDVGGVNELVEDGKTGLLVNPDSKDELSNKTACLLEDKSLANNLGANLKEKVKNKFDSRKFVRSISELYIELTE